MTATTHRYFVEPRQVDFSREDPCAGLIRVSNSHGHSFALPYGPAADDGGPLLLRLGPHALSARQLRALAALLENQQRTAVSPSQPAE